MGSLHRQSDPFRTPKPLAGTFISLTLVLMLPQLACAASQNADAASPMSPASQEFANAQEQADYNGDDATRPLNLLQLRYTYKTAPGTTRTVTTNTLTLRADRRIDLSPDWQLAFRTDLPMLATNPITPDNPGGEFRSGMGDAEFQASLIHDFNTRWAAGFGAKLIAPTGTDNLASGKWQVMPGAAFRVTLPEIGPDSYFVPLVRYDLSVAGDPSAKALSNLQIAPTLNLDLGNRWFFTFYPNPDIRLNFGDPVAGQTGRPFLPFDAMVGRVLKNGWVASLEGSVPIIKDYPVYDFKTEARVHVSY
jgi:Putative MetA-pathway of phenol degradation